MEKYAYFISLDNPFEEGELTSVLVSDIPKEEWGYGSFITVYSVKDFDKLDQDVFIIFGRGDAQPSQV